MVDSSLHPRRTGRAWQHGRGAHQLTGDVKEQRLGCLRQHLHLRRQCTRKASTVTGRGANRQQVRVQVVTKDRPGGASMPVAREEDPGERRVRVAVLHDRQQGEGGCTVGRGRSRHLGRRTVHTFGRQPRKSSSDKGNASGGRDQGKRRACQQHVNQRERHVPTAIPAPGAAALANIVNAQHAGQCVRWRQQSCYTLQQQLHLGRRYWAVRQGAKEVCRVGQQRTCFSTSSADKHNSR
mmetsp:Transcript_10530/g.33369  ORF Transcript_10530/g.33369 Transcript_10530/m.33369 type:complete len:238 (+) Transcript_10530:2397-3110(+)